ncbi:MAG TPA: MATE family efflux transporter, partial [Bacillota bacterium]|nr:MATE family efflux transporter [Bacillota bacterium]
LIAALLYFEAEWLMKIFIDNTEMIAVGTNYLRIISLAQIFMMLESIGSGIFNGIGKSIVPSTNGIIGNLLRIPLALWLSVKINESGIWWALNISDIFKGTVLILASIFILTRIEKMKVKDSIKTEQVAG